LESRRRARSFPPVSAPSNYLVRVSLLLEGVLALTEKVVAQRASWAASVGEWAFLLEVSGLTEHVLPPEAVSDPSVALGFLWFVRFSLETTMVALTGG
jgi:hypothetical protein